MRVRLAAACAVLLIHFALDATSPSLAAASRAEFQPIAERVKAWKREWPATDFARAIVPLTEIETIVGKDDILSIDQPRFIAVRDVMIENADGARSEEGDGSRYRRRITADALSLSLREPVISLEINGDVRAYPLRIMIWHEIVNDTVGNRPVSVTFCPLCNAAVVFERTIDGATAEFGTTGKLRNSDLVMYDRTSESWWQQFTGEGLVGAHAGKKLVRLPARLESFETFRRRFPNGKVLTAQDAFARPYGENPYINYDTASRPFLYRGGLPKGIKPLERVVAVGDVAYSLALLREKGLIEENGLRLSWSAGQASALDSGRIAAGRDVGNVVAQRRDADGIWRDADHDLVFAFAFHAFKPNGEWRLQEARVQQPPRNISDPTVVDLP